MENLYVPHPLASAAHASLPEPGAYQALDAVASGVVVLDAQGRVLHANDSALDLLSPGQAGTWSVHDLLARLPSQGHVATAPLGPASGTAPMRLSLEPGRCLDIVSRTMSDGRLVLTLVDIGPGHQQAWSARHDPLTGLATRDGLRDHLGTLLSDRPAEDPALGVLCIGLDGFKAVNDSLGHDMGDALLRKVADRLRRLAGTGGFAARPSGDEFALIHIDAAPGSTEALARSLIEIIGRTYVVEGQILNIGVSVGIAMAPVDGTDPDDLLRKANLALHVAKAGGRGTYQVFARHMADRLDARRALEFDLRKALAMRELRLAYQPQADLGTGRICGFEALLRWHHPERGVVPPADFVPLAEEIGLIIPIGEWVLRTACKQAASWPAPLGIAVNLSPVQFRSPHLVETIASALDQAGLDPSRLELEITEGALIENTETVLKALNQVRALGVRVSMDDFGTGYSSLSYLQRFPFDKIKIDQSFVRGPDPGGDKQAIVRAIAGLGASLGMRTTAEGVETPDQLERMRREGCTEVQGYLIGRPLSPEDALALLAAETPSNCHPGTRDDP